MWAAQPQPMSVKWRLLGGQTAAAWRSKDSCLTVKGQLFGRLFGGQTAAD